MLAIASKRAVPDDFAAAADAAVRRRLPDRRRGAAGRSPTACSRTASTRLTQSRRRPARPAPAVPRPGQRNPPVATARRWAGPRRGRSGAVAFNPKVGSVTLEGRPPASGGNPRAVKPTSQQEKLFAKFRANGQRQLDLYRRRANTALRTQRSQSLASLETKSGIALGIMALLSILLGWLVAGRALRPLRTMNQRAREITEESLHQRVGVEPRSDELGELAATFDALLERLERAFEAQRRFVANASHELRTPLTLERALVEVALADPDASVSSLRRCCERVLVSSAQQERVIDALLTLARGQAGVESREPVDLARAGGGAAGGTGDRHRRPDRRGHAGPRRRRRRSSPARTDGGEPDRQRDRPQHRRRMVGSRCRPRSRRESPFCGSPTLDRSFRRSGSKSYSSRFDGSRVSASAWIGDSGWDSRSFARSRSHMEPKWTRRPAIGAVWRSSCGLPRRWSARGRRPPWPQPRPARRRSRRRFSLDSFKGNGSGTRVFDGQSRARRRRHGSGGSAGAAVRGSALAARGAQLRPRARPPGGDAAACGDRQPGAERARLHRADRHRRCRGSRCLCWQGLLPSPIASAGSGPEPTTGSPSPATRRNWWRGSSRSSGDAAPASSGATTRPRSPVS